MWLFLGLQKSACAVEALASRKNAALGQKMLFAEGHYLRINQFHSIPKRLGQSFISNIYGDEHGKKG